MDFDYFKRLIKAGNTARGIKYYDKKITLDFDGFKFEMFNAHYILGQTLRQIILPDDHYHFSKAAKELYNKYKLNFNPRDLPWTLPINGKTIKFNSIFMGDHVKPINEIVNELYDLDTKGLLTKETFIETLNKIHLCVITKEEDRLLSKRGFRQKRENDYESIINGGAYTKCGIEIES